MGKTWSRRTTKGGGKSRHHRSGGFDGYTSGGGYAPSTFAPRHHEEKPDNITGDPETGTVSKFANGFGFIKRDNGGCDAFVHHSKILMDGYRKLDEGARVRFIVEQGSKGIQAVNVEPLGNSPAYERARQTLGLI